MLKLLLQIVICILATVVSILLLILHFKSKKLRNYEKIQENENSVVLITGCDSGFGRLTTLYLLERGYHVISTVLTSQGEEELKDEAKTKKGVLNIFRVDITNQNQVDEFGMKVQEIFSDTPQKQLKVLINNAGISIPGPLEVQPIAVFCKHIDVNVIGHVRIYQQFAANLRISSGRIINIASIAGRLAVESSGAYCASKFAMEGLSDTMRLELMPWNVAVVTIEPGFMKTPLVTRNADIDYCEALWNSYSDHAKETYFNLYEQSKTMPDRINRYANDPNLVVSAIYEAISSSCPKTRYLVGTDAKLLGSLRAILPDIYFDCLIKLLF